MKIWFRVMMILPILFFPFPTEASDQVIMRTSSKGHQPHFQIVGKRIDYVWHEDHGPNREKRLPEEYVEVVEESGKLWLRDMKPLPVGPRCITSHGPKENIPLEVQAILKERYPDDRATGFLVGDLRGAISVKIALSGVNK